MTASPRAPALGRLERDTVRLTVTLLEKRAAVSREVVISNQLAMVIAKHLRTLLEGPR